MYIFAIKYVYHVYKVLQMPSEMDSWSTSIHLFMGEKNNFKNASKIFLHWRQHWCSTIVNVTWI